MSKKSKVPRGGSCANFALTAVKLNYFTDLQANKIIYFS